MHVLQVLRDAKQRRGLETRRYGLADIHGALDDDARYRRADHGIPQVRVTLLHEALRYAHLRLCGVQRLERLLIILTGNERFRVHDARTDFVGIGKLKRESLVKVKDPVALALMRDFKKLLDPNGILNPGKVL